MVNLSLSKKPEESWGGKCSCGSGKVRRFGLKGGPRTALMEEISRSGGALDW